LGNRLCYSLSNIDTHVHIPPLVQDNSE
jgi:hypothetical protein